MGGKLDMTLMGNFNRMTAPTLKVNENFKGKDQILISPRELQFIISAAPPSKFHYSLSYKRKKSSVNLNMTYFSKVELTAYSEVPVPNNTYQPRLVTDLSYSFNFTKNISLMVGANNLFDVYPSIQSPDLTESGGQWEAVQNGNAGAFFFTRFDFKF